MEHAWADVFDFKQIFTEGQLVRFKVTNRVEVSAADGGAIPVTYVKPKGLRNVNKQRPDKSVYLKEDVIVGIRFTISGNHALSSCATRSFVGTFSFCS